jgi:hypothetical protein
MVHRSVFAHVPGIPAIKGEVYLFCAECDEADSFYVDWQGVLLHVSRVGVDGPVPNEWLTEIVNRQEFEAYVTRVVADPDSLEKFKIKLRMFVSKITSGDEVWSFASPPESWANLMGRAGFAITSAGGEIACSLVTELN